MLAILTPLELKVMHLFWRLKEKKAFVKNLLEEWPEEEKKPAYNTISTIVRILEKKGYLSHIAYGRTYEYYPVVTKGQYQRLFLRNAIDKVFSGSVSSLMNTLVGDEEVSAQEIEALKKLINED